MASIAKELGQHVPGIVRIDLYAIGGSQDVYFSEFTFASNACEMYYEPLVADGLLYAILHEKIDPLLVDAGFVERTING
jgi:hypothetical protein